MIWFYKVVYPEGSLLGYCCKKEKIPQVIKIDNKSVCSLDYKNFNDCYKDYRNLVEQGLNKIDNYSCTFYVNQDGITEEKFTIDGYNLFINEFKNTKKCVEIQKK